MKQTSLKLRFLFKKAHQEGKDTRNIKDSHPEHRETHKLTGEGLTQKMNGKSFNKLFPDKKDTQNPMRRCPTLLVFKETH